MGERYSFSGDSRVATNLTVDTSSVNITLSVQSQDKVATVHWLGIKMGTHEVAKYQTQLLQ